MTFNLDFNLAFPSLGEHASAAVETATDMLAADAGSPASTLAALGAVRASLFALAVKGDCNKKTMLALEQICSVLKAIEAPYAQKAKARKPGHPVDMKKLERQAAAVIAREWLHGLKTQPLSWPEANKRVAACASVEVKDLLEWKKDFGRKKPHTRRVRIDALRQQVRNNVRSAIWEEFHRTWREVVWKRKTIRPQNGEPAFEPVYSKAEYKRDHLDLSPEEVLEWLRKALD